MNFESENGSSYITPHVPRIHDLTEQQPIYHRYHDHAMIPGTLWSNTACIMFRTNLSHTKATSLSGTSAARWLE